MSTATQTSPTTAGPVHPSTGRPYVLQSPRLLFRARALDIVLATLTGAALVGLADYLIKSMLLGSLSLTLMTYEWATALVIFVAWFAGLFLFGAVTGVTGTPGDALTGTRSVRISDGSPAGAWTGGWRAVKWSFVPLLLSTILSGPPMSFESRFVAIDVRASADSL